MNGGWGDFGAWGECPASCGGAYRSRYRACNNPAPVNGGEDCTGSNTETEICNPNPCPSKLHQPDETLEILLPTHCLLITRFDFFIRKNTIVGWFPQSYVLGTKGSSTCDEGSVITTTTECEAACDALGKKMGHPTSAIDGNPCYITGTQRCKQDGRPNRKAQLVCST